jgi:hypothetical protein
MKFLSSAAHKRRRRLRQTEELAVKLGNLQLIGIIDPDKLLEDGFRNQIGRDRAPDESIVDYGAKTFGIPAVGLRALVTALMAGADPAGFSLADSLETYRVVVLLYLSMQKESPALKN